MYFRNVFTCASLVALSFNAHAVLTGPTNYTVGTIFTQQLAWQKPDGVKRNQAAAAAFCAASTNGGLSGWSVPTRTDLANLYFEKGSSYLTDNGWALDVYQTNSQALDGNGLVVSMADGSTAGTSATGLTTCIHTPGPTGYLSNKNLVFLRPDATKRTVSSADAFCANNTTGGLQGWRLPTTAELAEIYFLNGSTNLIAQGWPGANAADWMWSATPYSVGREVVNMNTGATSWDTPSGTYYTTCVHDPDAVSQATIISKGLRWLKPDATNRTYTASASFCAGTLAGVTGWRLPTLLELQALYFEKGWTELAAAQWPGNYVWTSDIALNGHAVLRVTDGISSYAVNDALPNTCVKPVSVEKLATINNGSLTFVKPSLRSRPVEDAVNYCESNLFADKGGWRMPTNAEVQALYTARGSTLMVQAGFPANASSVWTEESAATAAANFVNVEGNGTRLFLSCVNTTNAIAYDKLVANGMQWDKPSSIVRPWASTDLACVDKVTGGQTGWRLPSKYELQALQTTVGTTALNGFGWSLSWNWSYNMLGGNTAYVVRLSDNLVSNVSLINANRYAQSCVRDANAYPAGTFSNAGLTFAFPRPQPVPQPLAPAQVYCQNATIGGLTGWRSPTMPELSALYAAQTTKLVEAGWASDYYWTTTPYSSGFQVIRMGDGFSSWANGADANRYYIACVR